ncbi:MAG TPA: hypothetical protein VH186_34350 [Chloroflexia bacterium]|nr:hypothetical protein [Chloroflexia bacterium]
MNRYGHGPFFNFVFVVSLVLILGVFGAGAYLLLNNDVNVRTGSLNPGNVVLVIAAGIGLLAFFTALFYLLGRLDSYFVDKHDNIEVDETYMYSARRPR